MVTHNVMVAFLEQKPYTDLLKYMSSQCHGANLIWTIPVGNQPPDHISPADTWRDNNVIIDVIMTLSLRYVSIAGEGIDNLQRNLF